MAENGFKKLDEVVKDHEEQVEARESKNGSKRNFENCTSTKVRAEVKALWNRMEDGDAVQLRDFADEVVATLDTAEVGDLKKFTNQIVLYIRNEYKKIDGGQIIRVGNRAYLTK